MALPNMIASIKAPKFIRELDQLVKAIGECKSKAEEDRIIVQEVEVLKQRLHDPRLDKSRGREYMVRLMYCEMLGHDVAFAYIHALQFCSDANLSTKKAAYLALTQFLDYNSDLVLLLVNTLLTDLKSDNFVVVCTALSVVTKLISRDLVNAIYPAVAAALRHPREHVRKKAVMALLHFQKLDPLHTGPLAGVELDKMFRASLCDKDPAVMAATLAGLQMLVRQDPKPYRNLVPSFVSILKQVCEHRLPKAYDYHRFPAPFIQIRLLKLLAALGAGDKAASDNMYAVIQQVLKRAHSSHTIGNAIIYEAVRTITTIAPNPQLLAAAAESVTTLLRSPSHNLKYIGLDALAGIVKISPQYAQQHQLAVVDCLEDPDDTLKLKTLELLYRMTKANNVEVIAERMMAYLRSASDEHIRRDIVRKLCELAERYAPDTRWFISTMAQVFELGGEHVEPSLAHNLMRLVAEQDAGLQGSAVTIFAELLQRAKLPDILLQTATWVVGEYGAAAGAAGQLVPRLCAITHQQQLSEQALGLIISALAKLAAQSGQALPQEARELLHRCSTSRCVELQQRASEVEALTSSQALAKAVLPADASCEEFDATELITIRTLSFLNAHVNEALAAGAAPYVSEEQRLGLLGGQEDAAANRASGKGALKYEAYEPAQPSGAAAAAMAANAASLVPGFEGMGMAAQAVPAQAAAAAYGYGAPAQHMPVYQQQQQQQQQQPAQVASSGPQLMLNAGGGARRWGPAMGAGGPEPPRAQPAPALAAAQHVYVQPSAVAPASSGGGGAVPARMTEKDRLAASLFGSPTHAARQQQAAAPRPAPPKPAAPAIDLLMDFDDSAPATSAPAAAAPMAAAPHPTDLLMAMDSPGAMPMATGAPAPAANLLDLDALYAPQPMAGTPPQAGAGMMGAGGYLGGAAAGGMSPQHAQQQAQQQQQQGMGYGMAQPGMHGGMAAAVGGPRALNGGAAKSTSKADPFKDLLG